MQASGFQINQSSRASADALNEPINADRCDHSCLDRKIDRYGLLLLAKRVGKEWGFTPRMLQLLEYYLAYTTANDWEEGSRPIVFQSLARTAMDLGVGERQIQKLEKRLFDVGAICWNDSGNHKRYGRRDPRSGRLVFAYGVDLTPLAHLEEALQAKLHEKQLNAEAWRATKRQISETRRRIRERLNQLREEEVAAGMLRAFDAEYCEIAIELRSHLGLPRLRELLRRHKNLLEALRGQGAPSHRSRGSRAVPIDHSVTPNGSRRHGQEFAHQEHTTPQEKKKGHASQSSGVVSETHPPRAIGKQSPRRLANQASEALRAHLPLSGRPITWNDLLEAASRRRVELGISRLSWTDACGSIGRANAIVGLVMTDRAACRDKNPVKHTTAYFRRVCQGISVSGAGHSS